MGIVLRDKTRAHSQGDISLGKLGPAQPNLQPAVSMTAELPGFKEQSLGLDVANTKLDEFYFSLKMALNVPINEP